MLRHLDRWILAVALAAALLPTPVRAQTLLENGFFDHDTSGGWLEGNSPVAFEGLLDADRDPTSGSARLVNDNPVPGWTTTVAQCVPLNPGTEYFASGQLRFTPGEVSYGQAYLVVAFHDDDACKSPEIAGVVGEIRTTAERGVWQSSNVGDFQSSYVTPLLTKSVKVGVSLYKPYGGGVLSINIDNVTLAPVGVPLCHGLAATLFGTNGPDSLIGTPGADVIVGLGGKDSIDGRAGDDVICGGRGDDTIAGGGGADRIYGEAGDDILKGGSGKDVLVGGPGSDTLRGAGGDDRLVGGDGYDFCFPGAGDSADEAQCEPIFQVP